MSCLTVGSGGKRSECEREACGLLGWLQRGPGAAFGGFLGRFPHQSLVKLIFRGNLDFSLDVQAVPFSKRHHLQFIMKGFRHVCGDLGCFFRNAFLFLSGVVGRYLQKLNFQLVKLA